jgi:hypothetical protein
LFLELFAKSYENSESEREVTEILLPVLSALGKEPPYEEQFLVDILKDMDDLQKTKAEIAKAGKKSSSNKRAFGSEFLKWYTKLETEQTLLLLTGFDFDAAYKLYSEVPALIVDSMIQTKLGYEWNTAEKDFEAVVFGMGGSIKGGTKDADQVFENKTEKGAADMQAQLKKMGF